MQLFTPLAKKKSGQLRLEIARFLLNLEGFLSLTRFPVAVDPGA
jgi:hypothetical protein